MQLRENRLAIRRQRRTARSSTPNPRAKTLAPATLTPGELKSGRLDPRAG